MGGTSNNVMYPLDTWPPDPQDRQGEHPCRAANGKPVAVGICKSVNTSPARNRICQGCACPWRICYQCTLEHLAHPDMRTLDPDIGLCPIHLEKYRDTVPRVVPLRRLERKPPPVQLVEQRDTVQEKIELDPLLGFDEERIRAIGYLIGNLSKQRQQVIKLLAEGVGRDQVAVELGTSTDSINGAIFQAGTRLNLNVDNLPGLKRDNLIQILVTAYRTVYLEHKT